MGLPHSLSALSVVYVKQKFELAEMFGFESRNKYAVVDESGRELAYAAEQNKGFLGFLLRQAFGHWRQFEIHFFDPARQPLFKAVHPFRFYFQRLEIFDEHNQLIGALERRFGLLTKKFDVQDANGKVLMEMRSGLFRVWTFPFQRDGRECAVIEKKFGGVLSEFFTDKDSFRIRFIDAHTSSAERMLILAASIFIDLQYFEKKSGGGLELALGE